MISSAHDQPSGMAPEEFKRQLAELSRVVFAASNYFVIWKALWPTEEAGETINRHAHFFSPVRNALRGMVLIELAKMFDGDANAISLTKLVATARRGGSRLVPNSTNDDMRRLARQLDQYNDLRNRIKQMRDQHLAHLDPSPLVHAPLPLGEIEALIAGVQAMLNDLSRWHDQSITAYVFQERDSARATGYVVGVLKKEAAWLQRSPHEKTAKYLMEVWADAEAIGHGPPTDG